MYGNVCVCMYVCVCVCVCVHAHASGRMPPTVKKCAYVGMYVCILPEQCFAIMAIVSWPDTMYLCVFPQT
jgi:hypothetical protein